MLRSYAEVVRRPGAVAFSAAGLVARLPISMLGLGIVLLVTAERGTYALAGALSATFALAASLIGPIGSRYVDRWGQHRVLPVLTGLSAAMVSLFVVGVLRAWPDPALFLLAALAGASQPNIASMVRARWALMLSGTPLLRTAFALESVVDELIFVVGPPLATVLALQVAPPAALLACVVFLVVGATALSVQRRTEPPPARHDHVGGPGAFRYPGMVVLTMAMVCIGGVFGSFEVVTVAFSAEQGAAGATGLLLALYALGSLIAGVVVGALHLRMPLHRQLLASAALLAVVTLPFPVVPGIPVMTVAAFLAGVAVSPVLISTFALVERLVPAQRLTEGLTLATSGIGIGLSVSASLAGWLIDTRGASVAYVVTAASGVLTLLATLAGARVLGRAESAAGGTASGPAASRAIELVPGPEPGWPPGPDPEPDQGDR
jgi:predicted MFS family arabinose efflux permease